MVKGVCKGCYQTRKLVKSHIIPRSFYEVMRQDKSVAFSLHTNKEGEYKSKSRIGAYDSNILCGECEDRFKAIDNYAASSLIQNESQHNPVIYDDQVLAHRAQNVEYLKIKFFIMTVLWRASISSLPLFRRIDLGPTTNRLKTFIWNGETGSINDYPVVIGQFTPSTSDPNLHRVIFDPYLNRVQGIRYYRFYLGGYIADIQASAQTPPAVIRRLVNNKDLLIRNLGSFDVSPEMKLAQQLVRN